ncbi:MAG TPA: hypothetical protein VGB25_01645 [Candidatus Binatia bacterium]
MALKLVKIRKESEQPKGRKSREEYQVACLREEVKDRKFSDWEKQFIASLARHVGLGRTLSLKQKEILKRLWEK